MGDFAVDTAIERLGDGCYRATLCSDWEIWGPMGGYASAIVMRAAGAEASLPRPSSYFCHFLSGTQFGPIDLRVTVMRRGRSAESLRAHVTQADREVMDATISVVRDGDGLEHEVTDGPIVPGPDSLRSMADYALDDDASEQRPFWQNFDARPVHELRDWPPPEPLDPVWRQWHRFVPTSTFDDPWTDAARYVLLCDLPSWPATAQHHGWKWRDEPPSWIAPTLDQYVAFHRPVPDEPWLLVDGHAPIAADGLLGCTTRLWSSDGQLVATGGGQGLFRRVPAPP
jgi:acyl-CoA thioesterase-2